eukprot:6910867-Prymnesium_polylepis.1
MRWSDLPRCRAPWGEVGQHSSATRMARCPSLSWWTVGCHVHGRQQKLTGLGPITRDSAHSCSRHMCGAMHISILSRTLQATALYGYALRL